MCVWPHKAYTLNALIDRLNEASCSSTYMTTQRRAAGRSMHHTAPARPSFFYMYGSRIDDCLSVRARHTNKRGGTKNQSNEWNEDLQPSLPLLFRQTGCHDTRSVRPMSIIGARR